jgi:hypothetical protein
MRAIGSRRAAAPEDEPPARTPKAEASVTVDGR